jgi:hypothetical protein
MNCQDVDSSVKLDRPPSQIQNLKLEAHEEIVEAMPPSVESQHWWPELMTSVVKTVRILD